MSKRVLITGGAGFIGTSLTHRLLADGNDVVCIDDLSTGSRRNIEPFIGNSRYRFVEQNVTTPYTTDVDLIYNLACPAAPPHYQRDPVGTVRTCVLGSINALDLAKSIGARVLQASTSEVYGDPAVHPQPESYWGHVNPIGPRSCYDEGKRAAETLFMDYHRQHKLPISIARIFNTYGPNMQPDDGRVVSNFIVQALGNADITIYGTGEQTRSFCYVDDTVDGLVRLMASGQTGPINIGNPVEMTMRDLADVVIELTGSRSRTVYRPLPADDPRQRRPDISLARASLGWEPKTNLRDGLARTIAYFDELLARA